MSLTAVAEFTNKLVEEPSLQQELGSAIGEKEGLIAAETVADIGAKYGYNFTAEEAQELRELVLASESGELSDEQLEAVAGGFFLGAIGGLVGGLIGGAVGGSKGRNVGSTIGSAVGSVVSFFTGW